MTAYTRTLLIAVLAIVSCTGSAHKKGSKYDRDITIKYRAEDGKVKRKTFDLLVVACDPKSLSESFQGKTDLEERVESALERFTLDTMLWEVDRPEDNAYSVRFSPEVLQAQNGSVYGFRDEVRVRLGRDDQRTLVTSYQFANKETTQQEMAVLADRAFNGSDPTYSWMGLETDTAEKLETYHDTFFPHFTQEDLEAGLPWEVLEAQGSYNTLYVSAFTAFESVLHIYEYGNMLENTTQVQDAFANAKAANRRPKVAIIGAGPSGMLFATQQLKRAGLTEFTIFEKTGRYGGKTNTYKYAAPDDPDQTTVVAELGTCYMGLMYGAFSAMLESEYGLPKPMRMSYPVDDLGPRGIVDIDTGEMTPYFLWVTITPDGTELNAEEFAAVVALYVASHYQIAGWNTDFGVPLPPTKPEGLPNSTYWEFLEDNEMSALRNVFTYGYSVQGYGNIEKIPAFYGLIWMTPDAFVGIIDLAASITEQLADAAEDAETSAKMAQTANTLKHGSKVAKTFNKRAKTEFQHGVRPSLEETKNLAHRCHMHVLADDDEDEEFEIPDDNVFLVQNGWQSVWDAIVSQEGLEEHIKYNVEILKIKRAGLGGY